MSTKHMGNLELLKKSLGKMELNIGGPYDKNDGN